MTESTAISSPVRVFPPCPLDTERQFLLAALNSNCNLVLGASPGAGKSSRVPLWLLDAPWLKGRNIILLEPRRVAARALANYMASLLGEELGQSVGLRMRDESRTSRHTRIEVVTEGVLTRLLQQNPDLPHTACVLFDEFHERSLTADTGLALCLESQAVLRPDLRILVMSATLDIEAVSSLMGHCPTIQCPGRAYPVDIRHMPPPRQGGRGNAAGASGSSVLLQHMAHTILTLLHEEKGGLLAFLPGAGEIRHVANLLEDRLPQDVLLCPLYGNLSSASQDEAIAPAPAGKRKVVLATSIAETSLTIEGVRMVVDAGLSRMARFDPASGLTSLITERVSRAGADQRTGRAGRTEPGICCRLWPVEEEKGLRPHMRPEILDADLAGLLLQLAAWGTSDPASMAWLDTPPAAHLSVARQCLELLGALDGAGKLTTVGNRMAQLPLAPRTARMLLWGALHNHGPLACCLAALLEEKDPLMPTTQTGRQGQWATQPHDCDLGRRIDWLCHTSDGKGRGGASTSRQGMRLRIRRMSLRLARFIQPDACGAAPLARKDTLADNFFASALADVAAAGMLVAVAWPEQVGMLQPNDPKTGSALSKPAAVYRMRSGRAGQLSQEDPLARQDFLAVAHLDGALPHGRIRLAAPLSRKMVEEIFAQQIVQQDVTRVSESGQLITRRQKILGSLALESTPLPRPKPEQAAEALCAYVRERGLNCLPWNEHSLQWRARVALLRQLDGAPWPPMDDAALLEGLENWLAPALEECTALASLQPAALGDALHNLLPNNLRHQLEKLAPAHWQVPSGAQRPILYGEEGGPTLDVKLQEMFGCVDTPTIAQGRIALLLRLNSPAGRPLQVTRDLAHFWRNGYLSIRSEMRGRYPRHPWPEDPLTAVATALTKKKLAATGKK